MRWCGKERYFDFVKASRRRIISRKKLPNVTDAARANPRHFGLSSRLFLRLTKKRTRNGCVGVAQEEGFEPPWAFTQTVFKKLTAFPISSLTLPNRVGFYPKNRPFLHVFCIFARNLREKCEKTTPTISLIFFIFSSVSSSANFE